MNQLPKKLILLLIAIGLLWGFQTSSKPEFTLEKAEFFDSSEDSDNSKKENCELEDLELSNPESKNFKTLKISLLLQNQDDAIALKRFSFVLTPPPNT